ncbi:E3 ubiquitin-protein ligase TRIM17-like [Antechinus flavipes]|uniref:E3 ubiquitin-protein ligase TRIM17-like n=1 Tax=Antechinus flavipes TaxID=38775 RepID=UPI002235E3D4|nr:E3 ubiquitin-protein ligase TRIM17-like [Antechinus flavipes]
MVVKLIEQMRNEVTCSTCSHYYSKPVTIYCGHSFCQECFLENWNCEAKSIFCPECKVVIIAQHIPGLNYRLDSIVDLVKELERQFLQNSEEQSQCPIHQKFLKLFCEDHQTAICVICSEAQEHEGHTLHPIEKDTPNKPIKQEEDNDKVPLDEDRNQCLQDEVSPTLQPEGDHP